MIKSTIAIEITVTFILAIVSLLVGISLIGPMASSVDSIASKVELELGISALEAQITLIFTTIIVFGVAFLFMKLGNLMIDEDSDEMTSETPSTIQLLDEPKTENCKNCGGPNVDRVTCEWCGKVLE